MKTITLDRYKTLLQQLHDAEREAEHARSQHAEAQAKADALAADVKEAEAAIVAALASFSPGDADPLDILTDAEQPSAPGVRASFYELLRLIPVDGSASLDDLRPHFKLTDGALAARISKCKKAGFLRTAGWGRYSLTDKGSEAVRPRLEVVK